MGFNDLEKNHAKRVGLPGCFCGKNSEGAVFTEFEYDLFIHLCIRREEEAFRD